MEQTVFVTFLYCFVFSCFHSVVLCEKFIRKPEFQDKTCPSEDIVFTETAPSKIVCANKCFDRTGCKGVSYSPTDLACTGCNKFYATPTDLVDIPDSFFFALAECGELAVLDTHVVLGTFDGNSLPGAQVSYNCTPCTFFPQTEPAVITCQDDATWSTPVCVYGPSIGKLPNGQLIPEGAIGCASTFNNTCSQDYIDSRSALLLKGSTGSCYCDEYCCSEDDCCFDSTCNDVEY